MLLLQFYNVYPLYICQVICSILSDGINTDCMLKCLVFIYLHHIKINKTIYCNAFIRKKNHKNEHLEDIHIHSRVPYSFFGENIRSQIFITCTFWLKCYRDSRVPYSFLNENIKTLISLTFSTEIVLPFFNMAINLMWQ